MRAVLFSITASVSLSLAGSALAADTWTTPQPGIELLSRVETGATPQRISAAYVSLCKDGMHARATKYAERKQRTSTWAESVGALVAVNGAFFDFTAYNAIGWSIGDGEAWPTASDPPLYTAVAFASFGRAKIFRPEDKLPPAETFWREMVPGSPLLLDDGVVVEEACYSHYCERHPRTAVGLTPDQRKAILVTVDGRSSAATGMTRIELANLMKSLGAHRAMNFDGGGSTTMYVKGRGVVNTPSDGSERVVSSHLGFTSVAGEKGCCSYEPVPGSTGTFGDVPDGSWVEPYAEALYQAGVTAGCQESPRLFCPDCVLDRGALATLIAKGLGLAPISPVTFSDIPAEAPYGGYAEALRQAGIASGCGGGGFCPERLATRFEAAAFVARGMGLTTALPTGKFSDVTAAQAGVVEALAGACVISGCGADTFCPDVEITRGQLAKMIAVGFSIGPFHACLEAEDGGAAGPNAGSDEGGRAPGGANGANGLRSVDVEGPGCGCRAAPALPTTGGLLALMGGVLASLRRLTRRTRRGG